MAALQEATEAPLGRDNDIVFVAPVSARTWFDRVPAPFLSATPDRRLSAPALPAPVQQGTVGGALPAFIGAPPGSHALVREDDTSEGA